jgi:hypothetical protein
MLENRVLRRISGSKREISGKWKKLQNEALDKFCTLREILLGT